MSHAQLSSNPIHTVDEYIYDVNTSSSQVHKTCKEISEDFRIQGQRSKK